MKRLNLGAKPIHPVELDALQRGGIEWCEKRHDGNHDRLVCKQSMGFFVDSFRNFPLTSRGLTHMTARAPIEMAFDRCGKEFKDERFGTCVDAIEHAEAATRKLLNKKAMEERGEALVRVTKPGMKGFTLPLPGCARIKAVTAMNERVAESCSTGPVEARGQCQLGARAFLRIARDSFPKRGICTPTDLAFVTQSAMDECDQIRGGRTEVGACKMGVRDMAEKVKKRYFFTRFKFR